MRFQRSNLCFTWAAIFLGLVPGDIYSDLHRSKLIPEPLFGDNHLHLSWIAAENWTYTKTFSVDLSILKYRRILLLLKGVDTVSTVVLNDDILLNTTNQFVEYYADLTGSLKKNNKIEIRFTSPVLYAEEKSSEYSVSSVACLFSSCSFLN
ncbi:hypothetical protein COOONC_17125 [Cooperia oncophora]